ncbi:LacI family DNA-binding transcriptional regulator [Sphingomonas bacterium]|uniref:LacI family DNA-binding transcriptional regulator n=1 Tax=Sphingomonas bacterium TaxID=1895847 RepID=UPI0015756ACE|nr:LacI family DNA-binding transcriptional regulator [Sphingomonas bacterium]
MQTITRRCRCVTSRRKPAVVEAADGHRRLTSEDVARAAGVSASAVSRAFTPGASVSPEKRARIVRAASELGYRPNVMARAVATQRSNVIGLILFSETNRHHPEVLLALSRAFSALGLRIMLFLIEEDEEIGGVVDHILSYRLDGVIAAATIPAEHRAQFDRARVPLLFYNRSDQADTSSVSCNHHASGEMIARHLMAGGHRSFALIRADLDSLVGRERMRGVEDALAGTGGVVAADFRGDFDYDHGVAAVRHWADRGIVDFTAIIAANDMMAIGAKDALVQQGRRVPEEVAVAGFDGIEAGRWLSYRIPSVGQPIEAMAQAAAEMMTRRIAGRTAIAEQRLFPGLLQTGFADAP